MKVILWLLFCLLSISAYTQKHDTVFIKRTITHGSFPVYHAIYIDNSRNSARRKQLTDFTISSDHSQWYFERLEKLKPFKGRIKLSPNFPRKWIALYKYKGKYYTYKPSEGGEHYMFEITDSTNVERMMEGREASRITRLTYYSPVHIRMKRTDSYNPSSVEIKIINQAKGIAVFTFDRSIDGTSVKGHRLMLDASKFFSFPTIINYCKEQKWAELEFDKIDYIKLLQLTTNN